MRQAIHARTYTKDVASGRFAWRHTRVGVRPGTQRRFAVLYHTTDAQGKKIGPYLSYLRDTRASALHLSTAFDAAEVVVIRIGR